MHQLVTDRDGVSTFLAPLVGGRIAASFAPEHVNRLWISRNPDNVVDDRLDLTESQMRQLYRTGSLTVRLPWRPSGRGGGSAAILTGMPRDFGGRLPVVPTCA